MTTTTQALGGAADRLRSTGESPSAAEDMLDSVDVLDPGSFSSLTDGAEGQLDELAFAQGQPDRSAKAWTCASAQRWRRHYSRRLIATDAVVIAMSVAVAQLVRFGVPPTRGHYSLGYCAISVSVVIGWILLLNVMQAHDGRVIGGGAEEYQRVLDVTIRMFGIIAVIAYLFKMDVARGYLAIALPLGVVGLMAGRWSWRRWLAAQRRRGRCMTKVLVVGGDQAALTLAENFDRDLSHGYRVVGVCVPGYVGPAGVSITVEDDRVPVLGDEHNVVNAIAASGADTVAVTATERLGPEWLNELTWLLTDSGVDMVVAPGFSEVASPRLKIMPAASQPLLYVEEPRYRGANRLSKALVDRVGAALMLLVASPVLLACAIAIKATSRGPVLYAAERMGIESQPFRMYKFRSMVVGADAMVASLVDQNDGCGPLFKMKQDPRVTKVGRVLRRYSLDELPQLFNVLRGEMSLVGPRPPLRAEVQSYTENAHRRMLVRPGITGLWQVSGRSDLPWKEAVRLDLSYVENWSLMTDATIIWKTVRAVLTSDGAY